ncbi:hypothetical protein DFH06DRAFT_1089840 [Mycena polygramma]|nr:hypothetical protein DFH06DRAFT_1089840 [Mycena polygramma]
MKFLSTFFVLTAASVSVAVTIPGEVASFCVLLVHISDDQYQGAYSTSNLSDLPAQPKEVGQALANPLLDVLQHYGLTDNFGVVAVHNHVDLAPGQIMFQHGNASSTHQEIAEYDELKADGVPYTYHVTTDATPALLPLDLGDITSGVLAARADLATAMGGNFLKDFSEAATGHLVGIAYIRPLDRAALENGGVVKNQAFAIDLTGVQYNHEKTAGNATAISLAAVDPTDEPSFFTRGVGNSTALSDVTM